MTMDFEQQLQAVRKMGLNACRQLNIDLSVVAEDKEYNLSGNFFYVKEAPDSSSYIDCRINSSGNNVTSWVHQTGFVHPFNRLYITTPAGQTGIMKILIASEAPELFDVIDNRSATGVLDELRGDLTPETWGEPIEVGSITPVKLLDANANRKSLLIQNMSPDDLLLFLGFDNTVAADKFFIILGVSSTLGLEFDRVLRMNDYRGSIWAVAGEAGLTACVASEW